MTTAFARLLRLLVLLCLVWAIQTQAAVLYVDVNSTTPVPPFNSWATAATNIQDAISAANAGDTVFVTNGTYQSGGISLTGVESNRVTITNAITVISASGPQQTIITGGPGLRCAYVGTNAVLSGFTLTGGHAAAIGNGVTDQNGGGAWCESSAVVSNCIFIADVTSPDHSGGGVYGGTVWNSLFNSNSSSLGGAAGNATLYNSTASANTGFSGAAAYSCISYNCTFSSNIGCGTYFGTNYNCLISGNQGYQGGGTDQSIDYSCVIASNASANIGGGVVLGKHYNCLIVGNQATNRTADGNGGGAADAVLYNCTIVSNLAVIVGGGMYNCSPYNCILYYNSAPVGSNWFNNVVTNTLHYCCTTPLTGTGSFTNAPLFVDPAAGIYQLQISSPCVNAGNNAYVSNTTDLAGNPRISGGTVDIGAYELGFHYVAQASTNPVSPFSTWVTAATNIQDAVDAASNYDEVLVTNGTYQTGNSPDVANRFSVTNAITVLSVNGPATTIINGANLVRGAYLSGGAVLSGFTITNGSSQTNGGGVYCPDTNELVTNCIIVGNVARVAGGGVYSGTVNNTVIYGNHTSLTVLPGGGGAFGSVLNSCSVISNSTYLAGAGAVSCTLNGCFVSGNSVSNFGGGVFSCALNNCTVVGNTALMDAGGADDSTLNNCIIISNSAPLDGNYGAVTLNYCCTTPLPTNGIGDITNNPQFVNPAGGDFHLQSNSPCINAGNNAYVSATNDLDGNPRISGGTVDMGAYEFQNPASIISYAWLEQYGFATDGSADFADPDHDGMNNYQEWRAGTHPTNPLSLLQVLSAGNTNNPPGIIVTWDSEPNINYYLQRATNLTKIPAFQTIATNLPGQSDVTSYTDTNAPAPGPYFYRIGVQ